MELVLSGHTYQQTADELGYANRGTVHRIVQQALADHEAESIDELRALEVARLDRLQRSYWDQALGKDLRAAGLVLRIIEQRCRLLGLLDTRRAARSGVDESATLYTFGHDGRLVPA